jgi:transmembrane sensor
MRMTRRGLGVAVVGGAAAWLIARQFPLADYRTATGERRKVVLPDGSTAELSGASALSVDFQPTLRRAVLLNGEAFFTVAPESGRLFRVEAGPGETTTESATFNVNALSQDDVEVTVVDRQADVRLGADTVSLGANRQVTYGGDTIGAPVEVDAANVLAWRDGRLVFVSTRLSRVISVVNRWRQGKIVIADRGLSARPVTLIVNLDRAGDIVSLLEQTLPVRAVNITPYLTLLFSA